MQIGVPTEIKNNEYRVALTPAGVAELTRRGHQVAVQAGAGLGSAIEDRDFKAAGAEIVNSADQVWAEADLLLKVKEPIEAEYARMRKDQTLFTYLHLAASRPCTDALLASGTTSIAYETVQTADGALPLLAPMSEVAGRLSAQVGAYHLMRTQGGRGVLMGGVPGVAPAKVVVIGGGNSGFEEGLFLTQFAEHVTIVVRTEPIASRLLQDKVAGHPRITVLTGTEVAGFVADEHGKLASLRLRSGDEETEHPASAAFVFVGLDPNTGWLGGSLALDDRGFVDTDRMMQSSVRGVFAAGDVRSGSTKQLASAVGEGAAAALDRKSVV